MFPHEVVGFSGGTKYFVPGIAGPDIINFTHWLGALITNFDVIGSGYTSVRAVIDRAAALVDRPVTCASLVVTHEGVAGLYIGGPHAAWEAAAALSARTHIVFVDRPFSRVLSVMPAMYADLWTAAKGMYKMEPAVADGGEVVIYAPHITEVSYTHGRIIDEINLATVEKLPIKELRPQIHELVVVGERIDDEKAAQAVKALYATGFYADVSIEADGDVLVVAVQERPAIASIDVEGAKEFTKENLKDGLKQAGIAEAKIYDKSLLDRAEKELKRQYTSRGFYSSKVRTTVTPLERNRVALRFDIEEGEITRIADINLIGTKDFSVRELLRQMQLTTPGWLTWITKDDQYSRQKLTGDLESLRSFYLNRGYLESSIESTQVSITPDREKIFITIALNEGPV